MSASRRQQSMVKFSNRGIEYRFLYNVVMHKIERKMNKHREKGSTQDTLPKEYLPVK